MCVVLLKVLCDNPSDKVPRQTINLKHVNLTDIVIKVPHGAGTRAVRKAFDKEEVSKKWEKTAWAQKLQRKEKRTKLNDFDRFKLKLAKQKVSKFYLPVKQHLCCNLSCHCFVFSPGDGLLLHFFIYPSKSFVMTYYT